MRLRSVLVAFVSVALGGLSGCGGDPLDYETAMNLLRERATDPVRMNHQPARCGSWERA